ncbi:MAG: hypothetical protein OCD02_19440 [Spirochaetaceae bacterium]
MSEKCNKLRMPTIVLPFMPSSGSEEEKDLFIYLRPETNGVKVESLMFGVIHNDPLYRDGISLAYLGNLPGDFVSRQNIIQRHYALKCEVVDKGRSCFTKFMIKQFEKYFCVKWDEVKVVSSFKALEILNIKSDELFNLWVKDSDFFYIHGQSIKKVGDLYIINHDIPELLHKNNSETDIAVMVLRTKLSNKDLTTLITKMEIALKEGGAISSKTPPSRCFHYSRSPLDEILDGLGYLYNSKGEALPVESISFVSYLLKRGISLECIMTLVNSPIGFIEEGAIEKEVYLYDYLIGDSYNEAYKKIIKIEMVKEAMA